MPQLRGGGGGGDDGGTGGSGGGGGGGGGGGDDEPPDRPSQPPPGLGDGGGDGGGGGDGEPPDRPSQPPPGLGDGGGDGGGGGAPADGDGTVAPPETRPTAGESPPGGEPGQGDQGIVNRVLDRAQSSLGRAAGGLASTREDLFSAPEDDERTMADEFFRSITFGAARTEPESREGEIAQGFVEGVASLPEGTAEGVSGTVELGQISAREFGELGQEIEAVLTADSPAERRAAQRRLREARRRRGEAVAAGAGVAGAALLQQAREDPGRLAGEIVGGAGAGAIAGRGAGVAGRAVRDRVRTVGGTEVDLEDITQESVIRNVETGGVNGERFPGALDEELFTSDPATAVREQAEEFTPDEVAEFFEERGFEEGSVLKKALDVEPEGPGAGRAARGFQAAPGESLEEFDFETPGAFVGPELSPNFLRIGEGRGAAMSARPGLPDLGGRPTGVLARTDVEAPEAETLEEFNVEMIERGGETTARTKPAGEVNPGEIEAVIPPGAEFADVGGGGVRGALRRAGVGSEFFTEVGGRRVPLRPVAPEGDIDAQTVADDFADADAAVGGGGQRTGKTLSELTEPLEDATDRPLPVVATGGGGRGSETDRLDRFDERDRGGVSPEQRVSGVGGSGGFRAASPERRGTPLSRDGTGGRDRDRGGATPPPETPPSSPPEDPEVGVPTSPPGPPRGGGSTSRPPTTPPTGRGGGPGTPFVGVPGGPPSEPPRRPDPGQEPVEIEVGGLDRFDETGRVFATGIAASGEEVLEDLERELELEELDADDDGRLDAFEAAERGTTTSDFDAIEQDLFDQ